MKDRRQTGVRNRPAFQPVAAFRFAKPMPQRPARCQTGAIRQRCVSASVHHPLLGRTVCRPDRPMHRRRIGGVSAAIPAGSAPRTRSAHPASPHRPSGPLHVPERCQAAKSERAGPQRWIGEDWPAWSSQNRAPRASPALNQYAASSRPPSSPPPRSRMSAVNAPPPPVCTITPPPASTSPKALVCGS